MSDVAIRVEGLGKLYKIGKLQRRHDTLRDRIADAGVFNLFKRRNGEPQRAKGEVQSAGATGTNILAPGPLASALRPSPADTIWALKDVSFDVCRGEVIGIIGRNGAGKSTLLKILSRITEPTEGYADINGRVASLLEVGTGFHQELTGRENIYLNGAILGMKRDEIERKFDEIVAFAEVEKFIDTPVKRYSSGMHMRLAFAVAAHLEPEILLIDEVLAVGDVAFQRKCLGKMSDDALQGRTVLFVSHNMQAVRTLCQKTIWLQDGQVRRMGDSDAIVEAYLQASTQYEHSNDLDELITSLPPDPNFRLRHVSLEQDSLPATTVLSNRPVEVVIQFSVLKPTAGLHVFVQLLDSEGTLLLESINNGDAEELPLVEDGDYLCRLIFPAEFLAPRNYEVVISASIANVRSCLAEPIRIGIDVQASGKFNRAYAGYVTPGKLAPLLEWKTELIPQTAAQPAAYSR
jgi:lipopolysaccharide transport system ATP-binding protein